MSYTFGEFNREGRLLDAVLVDATSAAVDKAIAGGNLARSFGSSYQLITENLVDAVALGATDTSVVASTKTFTIPGYTFTGKVGSTIHIRGDVAHTGNNGDFVVSSVTSAHVVVCSTASGLSDETFNPATTTITVERTDIPLVGTWEIDVSNILALNLGNDREVSDPKWKDISTSSLFAPAIVAVTAASSQYTQAASLMARAHRVVFHAASGKGYVSVFNYQKGL